jgi:hypothetical protein
MHSPQGMSRSSSAWSTLSTVVFTSAGAALRIGIRGCSRPSGGTAGGNTIVLAWNRHSSFRISSSLALRRRSAPHSMVALASQSADAQQLHPFNGSPCARTWVLRRASGLALMLLMSPGHSDAGDPESATVSALPRAGPAAPGHGPAQGGPGHPPAGCLWPTRRRQEEGAPPPGSGVTVTVAWQSPVGAAGRARAD